MQDAVGQFMNLAIESLTAMKAPENPTATQAREPLAAKANTVGMPRIHGATKPKKSAKKTFKLPQFLDDPGRQSRCHFLSHRSLPAGNH